MDYQKILLAYSDPKHDEMVLKAALCIAHRYGAELTIFHLNVQPATFAARGYRAFHHMYTEQEIEQQLNTLNNLGVTTSIKIVQASSNDVVKLIIGECKSHDLLVAGHNHMNFFEAHIIDSTEEKVINQISTHALVIPVAPESAA